jgi:hypothetical protein
MGIAKHHNQTVFFAVPGLAGGPGHCHFSSDYSFIPVAAMQVEEIPGMVAMAAKQIVATSEEGGRP